MSRLHRTAFVATLWTAGLTLAPLGLLAGCGDSGTVSTIDSSVVLDLSVPPPDLKVLPDLTVDATIPDAALDFSELPDLTDVTDLSVLRDLTPLPPDLVPPPDLTVIPDLVPPPDESEADMVNPKMDYQYVLNSLTIPKNPQQSAFDWDSTGPKNALADLITAITQYSIDVQTSVDDSVAMGQMVELMQLTTNDPMRMMDGNPYFLARPGVSKPNPDFSGAGMFGVDQNSSSSNYAFAGLQNSQLATFNISNGPMPVDLKLSLYLFGANATVVTLHASRWAAKCGIDPKSQAPGLVTGQINGVLSQMDLDKVIVPAVRAALNDAIKNQKPGAAQILADLDVGLCTTNGVVAMPGDKIIDDCEVTQNATFKKALTLDVAIYNQQGKYMPDGNNPNKDSWTVGIGFSGVQATWK